MRTGFQNRAGVEYDEEDLTTFYAEDAQSFYDEFVLQSEHIDQTYSEVDKLKDNLLLTNFRLQIANSLSIYDFIDGFSDEFEDETGINLTSSLNEIYDSLDDYYKNYSDASYVNVALLGTASGSSFPYPPSYPASDSIDNNTASFYHSGASANEWLKIDLGSSKLIQKIELVKRSGYGSRPANYKIQASDDSNFSAGTVTDVITTYDTNVSKTWTAPTNFTAISKRYWRVYCTASEYLNIAEFRLFTYDVSVNNLTLVSNSRSALDSPLTARIVILEEDIDSLTLNDDIKVFISKDGGNNFEQVLISDMGDFDSSKRILVGLGEFPSGSGLNIVYKIQTYNSKRVRIHAVGLFWNSF